MTTLTRRVCKLEERFAPQVDKEGGTAADVLHERWRRHLAAEGRESQEHPYPPGQYGYLTESGTLFYKGKIPNDTFVGRSPFMGGVALEADWNGRMLWEVRQPNHHHDARLLKNGNVLFLCATELPRYSR